MGHTTFYSIEDTLHWSDMLKDNRTGTVAGIRIRHDRNDELVIEYNMVEHGVFGESEYGYVPESELSSTLPTVMEDDRELVWARRSRDAVARLAAEEARLNVLVSTGVIRKCPCHTNDVECDDDCTAPTGN